MKLTSTIVTLFVVAAAAMSVGNVLAGESDHKNMTVALVNTTNQTNSTGENQTEVMTMAKAPSPSRRTLVQKPVPSPGGPGVGRPVPPPGHP